MDLNRKAAFLILQDVETKKAYSNMACNSRIKRITPPNPPFVRDLAYGVIRQKMYLDYVISNFVKTPISKLNSADLNIIRMGLYQLIYMNSVPDYAAVDESVELAKKYAKGREGFVNGVLRQYQRDKDYVKLPDREEDEVKYLSIKYSYEPWIVEQVLADYGAERAEKILESGNDIPPLTLRVNTLITSREDLNRRLTERGVTVRSSLKYDNMLDVSGDFVLNGRFFMDGLFSVQDEGALECVKMLDPHPGEFVIDTCAAPGGKTMAVAEAMDNFGTVVALDVYKRKIYLITEQATRLGIKIVNAYTWDAMRTDPDLIGKADRVLCDVPCSGIGTARRKPEVKYKEWDMDMEFLPRKQRDILTASSAYVKPGGILQYSTCTILKRENNEVVNDFLRTHKDFSVVETKQLLTDSDGTDGFFICKLQRKDSLV
jgi:16S rRNA (cytosine967-C5)-methyltransferase